MLNRGIAQYGTWLAPCTLLEAGLFLLTHLFVGGDVANVGVRGHWICVKSLDRCCIAVIGQRVVQPAAYNRACL